MHPEPMTRKVLVKIDYLICMLFFIQFMVDFLRSDGKTDYLRTHWIDLVASIPVIEALRFARLIQIFRLLKMIHSVKDILRQIQQNKKEATIASVFLLLVMLLLMGSSLILIVEKHASGGNIHTSTDALWWAFVTISTVGYGDHYPVTNAGKLIASMMIVCGVGIFGMISGLVTSLITTSPKMTQEQEANNLHISQLLEKQEEILKKIAQIEATLSNKAKE